MSGPEHGGFQVFSDLDEATYSALKESIAARGVLVPIAVDQGRRIIDGHNRARAARELGVECPEVVVEIEDHQDGEDVARLLNTVRRHLDVEQRRSVVAELRQAGHSLRAIAGAVGTSKATVERDLAGVPGGTPAPERSTGADGKSYPATKPKPEPQTFGRCVTCGAVKPATARPQCDACRKAPAAETETCQECGEIDPPGIAGGICVDCLEKRNPPERQPRPPTLRDLPEVQGIERIWKPAKALSKALQDFPSVEEASRMLPADSMEVFDDIAESAARWAAGWKQARKANGGLRLVEVNR